MSAPDMLLRCRDLVAALNETEGWRLSATQHERYAADLAGLVDPADPPDLQHRIATNYHRDHQLVAALRQAHHPDHALRWQRWMHQVRSILYHQGGDWFTDGAVDDEDLVQMALIALQRALPTYTYRSRFSVWTYSVVVRTIKRSARDRRRLRRAGQPLSLDQIMAHDPDRAPGAGDRTEHEVQARLFYDQIQRILAAHPDRRLRYIVHLAYIEDHRLVEIGERLHLPPARVRTLLHKARSVLSADPQIQAWFPTVSVCTFGCCTENAHG